MNQSNRAITVFTLILAAWAFVDESSGHERLSDATPLSASTSSSHRQTGIGVTLDYSGNESAVTQTEFGARLTCKFQKLQGEVTEEGFWLESIIPDVPKHRFRVAVAIVRRNQGENSKFTAVKTDTEAALIPAPRGSVEVAKGVVRMIRPGLVEEYSTSTDGLRQDFLVQRRVTGKGNLRLELEVLGARVEPLENGARLVLDGSGRRINYNRLHVTDAGGRALTAQMEVSSSKRIAVLVDDFDADYPLRVNPTFSDANWVSMGYASGPAGAVEAAVVDGSGNIFIGGRFAVVESVKASSVAKWDGSNWSALGLGVDGPVHALAMLGGELYAGGSFTTAGGESVNNVAKWNGSSWSALGSGVNGTVEALAILDGELYAGGHFTSAGEASANRVARWNGTNWSALGSGVDDAVLALTISGGELYAGGRFTTAGGVSANYVAMWNGSSWSAVGSGLNGTIEALAVSDGYLYAGGYAFSAGFGIEVMMWDGSHWGSLWPPSLDDAVTALAILHGDLYVGGHFTTASGESASHVFKLPQSGNWSALGSGMNAPVSMLTILNGELYAGGAFTTSGGVITGGFSKWNGTNWSKLGSTQESGVIRGVNALAISDGELYAGGGFIAAGGLHANRIAKWTGKSWSTLASGVGGDYFPEVYALATLGGELYAGGNFTTAGEVSAQSVAKWNGSSWSPLGTGVNGVVYALAASGSKLYAGGLFTSAVGAGATNLAMWNQNSWSALGSGVDGFVLALATSGSELYVGGNFTNAGSASANNIAKWNGSEWSTLGSGVNSAVQSLAIWGDELYVGGWFTVAGGVSANSIAKWNGSEWSALGSGVDGVVTALAISGGKLYAGGWFTIAGGTSANHLAKWNGSAWSALGSGLNGGVWALAISDHDLYAGGLFTTAGDSVSPSVARADLTIPAQIGACFPRPEQAPLTNNASGPVNLLLEGFGPFCWNPNSDSICFNSPGLIEVKWRSANGVVFSQWYRVPEIPAATYEVGQAIPRPGMVPSSAVPAGGPTVSPVSGSMGQGALWHAATQQLYATSPGDWLVWWTASNGCPRVSSRFTVVWPPASRFQTNVAGVSPVDLDGGGSFPWARLEHQEIGVGASEEEVQSLRRFSANGAGRAVLALASGNPADPETSQIRLQLVQTVLWNDPTHLHDRAVTPIGRAINNHFGYHSATNARPYLFHPLSRYCTNFHDRGSRAGPVIPVNRDRPGTTEDDMVLVYYQNAQRLWNPASSNMVGSSIAWPWKPVRYDCQWPATPDGTIVVASQRGSGPVPLEPGWFIYRQPDPARPGYNPNEEHALKMAARPEQEAGALRLTAQSVTVLEGGAALVKVQVNQAPSSSALLSVSAARFGDHDLTAWWQGTDSSAELLLTNSNWAGPHYLVVSNAPLTMVVTNDAGAVTNQVLGDGLDGSRMFTLRLAGDLVAEQTVEAHAAGTNTLAVVLSARILSVFETTQESFTLRLTKPPATPVEVKVGPTATTNPNVQVIGPSTFSFTVSDWDQPRSVTIEAGADVDYFWSTNHLEVVARGGLNAVYQVTVIEQDAQQPPEGIYALRDDLGDAHGAATARYSEPYALAVGNDQSGQPAVRVYKVLAEYVDTFQPQNSILFRYSGKAGRQVQPFYPLSTLPNWYRASYATRGPYFQDRKEIWWAKAAGNDGGPAEIVMKFFYPVQSGFDFPKLEAPPTVNTLIPLLDQRPGGISGVPTDVTYTITWPESVPELRVGETLVKPKFGLPAIADQTSVSIVYEQSVSNLVGRSVELIDPTWTYSVPLSALPGDLQGKTVTNLVNGQVLFAKLPPHLRGRFWWEPLNARLRFRGVWRDEFGSEEPRGYLLLNVVTKRDQVQFLFNPELMSADSVFTNALANLCDQAAQARIVGPDEPFDSLALTAGLGRGDGYVTLAFNNAVRQPSLPADRGTPVSMEILRVTCPLYRGEIKVIEPDDPFDERLTLRHTGDFAGRGDDYVFRWKYWPTSSGFRPVVRDLNGDGEPDGWLDYPSKPDNGRGALDTMVDGSGIRVLKDYWYICQYRPTNPLHPCGTNLWSEWTPPAFAEGWIKRVLAKIDPYRQKVDDYASASVDTIVSMISQAGTRSLGSIPLNREALNDYGLIEIYETVLKRGIELSIDGTPPQSDEGANKALLGAARRLGDLYALLGNEAYADASDPTIGFGTGDGEYGNVASSIHCFMDQTSSLLEEELALLRGLDGSILREGQLIDTSVHPAYNRLRWNFTRNITGGEVAYALNYNIRAAAGSRGIDSAAAQRMFPQGHGDAWGHYLTALKHYYRLIRNDNFDWNPEIEFVSLGGIGEPIPVNYMDERKFARIAAAKAQTGVEIVNLTYRQKYVHDEQRQWQGYADNDNSRAWGVWEWASRAGQGAYFDWVLGNALLPSTSTGEGIQKVDRTTVRELGDVTSAFVSVQEQMDQADQGLNPLGLAKAVVPFDINTRDLIDRNQTHFEQIYTRAATAVGNAVSVFDHANAFTQRLRQQADGVTEFQRANAEQEADFNNRLIEVFGYPYEDDIGPLGSYPSGYSGPDLYHYMYVEPSRILGEVNPSTHEFTVQVVELDRPASGHSLTTASGGQVWSEYSALQPRTRNVKFHVAANGFGFVKPAHWRSQRRAPGEIQMAQMELLQAKARLELAMVDYENLLAQIEDQAALLQAQYNLNATEIGVLYAGQRLQESLNTAIRRSRGRQLAFTAAATKARALANAISESAPTVFGVIAGMAGGVITDPGSFGIRQAVQMVGLIGAEVMTTAANLESMSELDHQQAKELAQSQQSIQLTVLRQEAALLQQVAQLEQLVRQETPVRLALYNEQEAIQQSAGRYAAALSRGQRILEQRVRFRQQAAEQVQSYRYKDMAFRIFRNDALQKYRAQFDLAARYTFLAAVAYDYESNLPTNHPARPSEEFFDRIVRARAIGWFQGGQASTSGSADPGLGGPMAEMKNNFAVLKSQLGLDQPTTAEVRARLRYHLFRIRTGEAGNLAWRGELTKAKVADLNSLPEVRRHCIFPNAGVQPGLVFTFSTSIGLTNNIFGWSAGGGDFNFNPTEAYTKIQSIGLRFENYRTTIGSGLFGSPRAYLIPIGVDVVRSPQLPPYQYAGDYTRNWRVLDQWLPTPFTLSTSGGFTNLNWLPWSQFNTNDFQLADMDLVRRHKSMDVYYPGHPVQSEEADQFQSARLIGRSAWNTSWMLIIPGVFLLPSDPAEGVERFINGEVMRANGERDHNGVSEIQIRWKAFEFRRGAG